MEPFVLKERISNWPASHWTLDFLAQNIHPSTSTGQLTIRFGRKQHQKGEILFENESPRAHVSSLFDFYEWSEGKRSLLTTDGLSVNSEDYWGYFDYKYLFEFLSDERMTDIDWSCFGIDVNAVDSTIWIGTSGAYTPCHFDTYGFNLHAQLIGSKRWILFEPSENMKPTRLPYEESSVFSRVDVLGGDEAMRRMRIRMVTLQPGDVLFLPPGWWHSVQCVSDSESVKNTLSVSVNTWIPVEHLDRISQAKEVVVSILIKALTECEILRPTDLCPSESLADIKDSISIFADVVDDLISDGVTSASQFTTRTGNCEHPLGNTRKRVRNGDYEAGCNKALEKFLRDCGDQGITVPFIDYDKLVSELSCGPLTLVDCSQHVSEKPTTSKRSSEENLKRQFTDALTHPKVLEEIVNRMLT